MPFRKWDVALELMDYTDTIDPNNKRTAGLRNYVNRIKTLTADIERLEAKRRAKQMTDADVFALAQCYAEFGRVQEAAQLVRSIADRVTDANQIRAIAQLYLEAHLDADAETMLNRFLKENPQDATAWVELAKLQHRGGRRQAAQQSFIQAYQIDRQGVFARLQKDQELYEIAAPLFQRRK